MRSGRLVTIEGIDGSGKSTALAGLVTGLRDRGIDPLVLHEPGGTEVGEAVRRILLNQADLNMTPLCELLLFAASRSELTASVIRPSLAAGRLVICDRFVDSTTAYQGFARGLGWELTEQVNRIATGDIKIDRTLLLDLPVSEAAQRLGERPGQDRLDRETEEFRERTRQGYLALQAKSPDRIRIIDATVSPDGIVRQMLAELEEVLE